MNKYYQIKFIISKDKFLKIQLGKLTLLMFIKVQFEILYIFIILLLKISLREKNSKKF